MGFSIARSDSWSITHLFRTSISHSCYSSALNPNFNPGNSQLIFSYFFSLQKPVFCVMSPFFLVGTPDKELTALLAEAQVHLAAGELTTQGDRHGDFTQNVTTRYWSYIVTWAILDF
jgi:hypothetical protein